MSSSELFLKFQTKLNFFFIPYLSLANKLSSQQKLNQWMKKQFRNKKICSFLKTKDRRVATPPIPIMISICRFLINVSNLFIFIFI